MPIAAILQIIATLLPELIALAHHFETTPQEDRLKKLAEVKEAMAKAMSSPGNTAPIEDIVNG